MSCRTVDFSVEEAEAQRQSRIEQGRGQPDGQADGTSYRYVDAEGRPTSIYWKPWVAGRGKNPSDGE